MSNVDLEKLFTEDAGEVKKATLDNLSDLSILANNQIELQQMVEQKEEELKEIKERLRLVQEIDIPTLMAEIGMKSFVLDNGAKITIKQDIFASIRADHLQSALTYLDNIGLGGIIKDDVTVKFGKGEQEKAEKVMAFCRDQGYNAVEKYHVHPQTLKATIKGEMEKGKSFPDELFSITPFNKAIIKI